MQFAIATISAILAFTSAAPTTKRDFVSPKYPDMLPGAAVSYHCTQSAPCGVNNDPAAAATVYTIDGGITACGYNDPNNQYTDIDLSDATDDFIALGVGVMGSLSTGQEVNPTCGQRITVTNTVTGVTMTAPVVDKCPGCKTNWGLDMSQHLFFAMGGTLDAGSFAISWYWE